MERKKLLLVMLSIAILFGATYSVMFVTFYDVTDYGDIAIYNERTDAEILPGDSGTPLNVQDGDYLVVWLRDDTSNDRKPTDIDASARLYQGATLIEVGRDRETVGSSYRWWFDLDQCPKGTFSYHIKLYASLDRDNKVQGDSFSFQITTNVEPYFKEPVVLTTPEDISFDVDELVTITWTFGYDGVCEAYVSSDDETLQTQSYGLSTGERTFNYIVDTSVSGIQELTLTVNPDTEGIDSVSSDPVTITIGDGIPPTTTTTTTTTTTGTATTTTTTITTTTPIEEILGDTSVYMIAGIGIVILFVIIWRRNK